MAYNLGSKCNNCRGDALYDTIVSLGLVLLNEGNKPTFEKNDRTSIVDLTLVSPELMELILYWTVMNTEFLSDHKYIRFELADDGQCKSTNARGVRTKRNYKLLDETLKSSEQWDSPICSLDCPGKIYSDLADDPQLKG